MGKNGFELAFAACDTAKQCDDRASEHGMSSVYSGETSTCNDSKVRLPDRAANCVTGQWGRSAGRRPQPDRFRCSGVICIFADAEGRAPIGGCVSGSNQNAMPNTCISRADGQLHTRTRSRTTFPPTAAAGDCAVVGDAILASDIFAWAIAAEDPRIVVMPTRSSSRTGSPGARRIDEILDASRWHRDMYCPHSTLPEDSGNTQTVESRPSG